MIAFREPPAFMRGEKSVQLESQLGGDYSTDKDIIFGSRSTHTLLSHFDIDLNIITLLEGERKVKRPIVPHSIDKYDFYRNQFLTS